MKKTSILQNLILSAENTPEKPKPPEEQEAQGRWLYSHTEDGSIIYKCSLCGCEQGLSEGMHWCPSCQKRLAPYEPAAKHEEGWPAPAAVAANELEEMIMELEAHKYWHAAEIARKYAPRVLRSIIAASKKE